METVLVAGATGELGRHVARALKERGYAVRALTRSAARGRELDGIADEVRVGDATRPGTIEGLCAGVDRVFSCLGQSVSTDMANRGPGYHAIDYVGNHNLIEAARGAGVRRFVYVSVFGAERYPGLAYMRAHSDVERELIASGLSYGFVKPTGFFSALSALLDMAAAGRGTLFGDGAARSNPIHDEDLAAVCAGLVARDDDAVVELGGPEALTRREMLELAFAALGKPPRIMSIPPWSVGAIATLARPFAPRVAELMAFAGAMFTNDVVAPSVGTRRLGDYYAELAARRGLVPAT